MQLAKSDAVITGPHRASVHLPHKLQNQIMRVWRNEIYFLVIQSPPNIWVCSCRLWRVSLSRIDPSRYITLVHSGPVSGMAKISDRGLLNIRGCRLVLDFMHRYCLSRGQGTLSPWHVHRHRQALARHEYLFLWVIQSAGIFSRKSSFFFFTHCQVLCIMAYQ